MHHVKSSATASARTTTLARQSDPNSGETRLRAIDQPTATPELPSAIPLMALSTGFWAFKTLAAAHDLDLFSRLADGAGTTADELAQALGLHPRPAEMLLTGCAALGLLEKKQGRSTAAGANLAKRCAPTGQPPGTRPCRPPCSTARIR